VDEARPAALAAFGGAVVALVSLLLAAAAGEPYLSGDGVNGWIVVFAAGLGASLFAVPFLLERLMRPRLPDRDKRWERALLYWGGLSVVVLVVGIATGSSGDWAGDSLAGSAGLLITIEAALVIGTMVAWLLAG
jgi:hypothetical protein